MKIEKEDFLVQVKYSDLLRDTKNIGKYFFGFGGELYLSPEEIANYSPQLVENIKSLVKANRLPLRLHAPIMEIDYSQIQNSIHGIKSLYDKVFQLSKTLGITSVVAHAEFDYKNPFPIDKQFENSFFLWDILCDELSSNNMMINIENHCEVKPDYLIMLMKKLNSPSVGMCVDIGHLNAFGNLGIERWLERYPIGSIREVHLADNKGDGDSHLPLGDGNIDFLKFFETVSERRENPIFVLEPRNLSEREKSLMFLRKLGVLK